MKKTKIFLVIAILFCTFANVMGQSSNEHLTFKGVPIDGSVSNFVNKMKQKGFTYVRNYDRKAIMNGTFAGYNDCYVYIYPNGTDIVRMVAVSFPECKSWTTLYGNYVDIKSMLIKKYGTPFKEEERWDSYSEPKDDNSKIWAVKMERCKFQTVFRLDNGIIMLNISSIDMHCNVGLVYSDDINSEKGQESAIEDL